MNVTWEEPDWSCIFHGKRIVPIDDRSLVLSNMLQSLKRIIGQSIRNQDKQRIGANTVERLVYWQWSDCYAASNFSNLILVVLSLVVLWTGIVKSSLRHANSKENVRKWNPKFYFHWGPIAEKYFSEAENKAEEHEVQEISLGGIERPR